MKRKLKWEEITGAVLFAAGAGMLCVSVFLSFSSDIWYDELFTMGLAGQPLGKLVSITARDVHPPLYYMVVKLFGQVFGLSIGAVTAAKLTSVLPFFLCLVYGAVKVRKNFGMLPAGLFVFLLPSMPQLGDYTVEARMYGYALFFVTAGMLHAYELAGSTGKGRAEKENWIALTLYALAACYTHYFACVAACMVYLYLFLAFLASGRLREKIRLYLASGLFCAAGFLPWLLMAVRVQVGQVKENYWIQPLSWRSLGGCAKFIFQPSFSSEKLNGLLAAGFFFIYVALLAGLLTRRVKRNLMEEGKRKAFFVLGCVGVLAGVVGFGFLVSFLVRPIFVYRYMMPALGLFWLAFGILAEGLKKKKILFFPLLGFLLVMGFFNYRAFYGEEMWKRVQMAIAGDALLQIGEEDIIVCNFDQTQGVVSYYLENESYLWYGKPETLIEEMYPAVHALVEGEFTDEAGIASLERILEEKGRFWFLGSGNARDEIIEKWEKAGIEAVEKASVMIERYWFNIYECRFFESKSF